MKFIKKCCWAINLSVGCYILAISWIVIAFVFLVDSTFQIIGIHSGKVFDYSDHKAIFIFQIVVYSLIALAAALLIVGAHYKKGLPILIFFITVLLYFVLLVVVIINQLHKKFLPIDFIVQSTLLVLAGYSALMALALLIELHEERHNKE